MNKKKLNLKNLEVKSFSTSHATKGGNPFTSELTGALLCSVWCGTGPTCPECAYTLPGQGPACDISDLTGC